MAHTVTTSTEADEIGRVIRSHSSHATVRKRRTTDEMAIQNHFFAVRLAFVVALALAAVILPAYASAETTKSVELDIRPGGTVYTFTEAIVRNFYPIFPSISFILNITLRFSKPHRHKMQAN